MWFEDGNVILVAQGIGFRVYKGALGRASEVFGDMFTLAKPSDPNTVEGCPVVELSDKAEDFLYLLDAVFAIGTR